MIRQPGWESRLYALERDSRQLGFAWGMHDCCSFAAAAVQAITGQQISVPGPYQSARQASRVLKERGGLQAAVTEILGVQPTASHFAQRGDIVLLSQPKSSQRYALAVCFGTYALAPADEGLVPIQMKSPQVLAVWHIGH